MQNTHRGFRFRAGLRVESVGRKSRALERRIGSCRATVRSSKASGRAEVRPLSGRGLADGWAVDQLRLGSTRLANPWPANSPSMNPSPASPRSGCAARGWTELFCLHALQTGFRWNFVFFSHPYRFHGSYKALKCSTWRKECSCLHWLWLRAGNGRRRQSRQFQLKLNQGQRFEIKKKQNSGFPRPYSVLMTSRKGFTRSRRVLRRLR